MEAPKQGLLGKIKNAIFGSPLTTYEPNATVADLQGFGHDMVDENGNWTPEPNKSTPLSYLSDEDLLDAVFTPTRFDK